MVHADMSDPERHEDWVRQGDKSKHYFLSGPSAPIDLRQLHRIGGALVDSPYAADRAMAGWPQVETAFWYGAHGGSIDGGTAEAAGKVEAHLTEAQRLFSTHGPNTAGEPRFADRPFRYELALAALPIYSQLARRGPITSEHTRGYSLAVAGVAERVLHAWQKTPHDEAKAALLGLTPELFAILAINLRAPHDRSGHARYVALNSTERQDRSAYPGAMSRSEDLDNGGRLRENWDVSVVGLHAEAIQNVSGLDPVAQLLVSSQVTLPSGLHHARDNGWVLRAKIQAENGLAVSFVRDRPPREPRFRGSLGGGQVLKPSRRRAASDKWSKPLGISVRTRGSGYIPEITSWGIKECVGTTDRDTALRALRILISATRGEGGYTKASMTELMRSFRRDMAQRLAATSGRLAIAGNGHQA
ncbi:MAG TPA: hypothetical protein VGS28_04730 [Candidatus Saccharimonadales bacterium]|nr:hypothetical protein [Candidatus Saccharimonadales bacterium]